MSAAVMLRPRQLIRPRGLAGVDLRDVPQLGGDRRE